MKRAIAAFIAIALMTSDAAALDEPLRWNIRARIIDVNGIAPEGPLSQIGFDWNLDFSVTVSNTEPAPDGMIPGGEHRQRLILEDGFSIDFDAPGDGDDVLLVGNGTDIEGAYLPRNQEGGDSADYFLTGIPIMNTRGEVVDTFSLRFGFFGDDMLLGDDDEFISMPDLSSVSGTGIFVEFENGAFAFGELVEWNTIIVPPPSSIALFGVAVLPMLRRRREGNITH